MKLKATLILVSVLSAAAMSLSAEKLVIIHTNDTHSQIDPMDDSGLGGVMRRKVLLDSLRSAYDNVVLVDAGDAVQGTLFFNIGRGEVEEKVLNALGYDYTILGNHEFDNGMPGVKEIVGYSNAQWLSSNYNFDDTELAERFVKYDVRQFGDKKIGFMAINLNPEGMISEGNYDGVEYLDPVKAANAVAWILKNDEGADLVVALTHIGYTTSNGELADPELIAQTENIDVVIGGHSHTLLLPDGNLPVKIKNLNGDEVLVAQLNKGGQNVGVIEVDLDNMTMNNSVIPVDSKFDAKPDAELTEIIAPFRHGIDSIMSLKIASTPIALDQTRLLNLVSDFALARGRQLSDNVDFAIMNKGGIRRPLPKGDITEGMIIMMQPFDNHIQVIDVKGSDLSEVFDVMAGTGGNGVSGNVEAVYDPVTKKCLSVTIDGRPLDLDKTYRVATIDYLANGGDYMKALRNGELIAQSENIVYIDLIEYLKKLKKVKSSSQERFKPKN